MWQIYWRNGYKNRNRRRIKIETTLHFSFSKMEKKFLEAKDLYDIRRIIEQNKSLSVGVVLVSDSNYPLYKLIDKYPAFTKAIEYYRDRTSDEDLIQTFKLLSYEEIDPKNEKMDPEDKNKFFTLLLNEKTAGCALRGAVTSQNLEKVTHCLTFPQKEWYLNRALVDSVPLNSRQTPHMKIVELLLEKGAKFGTNVDIEKIFTGLTRDPNRHSDYEILSLIMGEKEAKEFHQNIKNAALDIALQLYQTQSSKRDKIFELIKASLEIGAEPANIITVCYFAESFELAKLLLQYGADPNENPALLNTAVIHNRADLVELFLEYKIDIHQQTDNGLRTACEYGKYKIAEMLLKAGAKVSVLTQEPIRSASRYGHAEVVKLLLKYGANPRVKNKQALEWARKGEHTEVVEILEEWFEKEDE